MGCVLFNMEKAGLAFQVCKPIAEDWEPGALAGLVKGVANPFSLLASSGKHLFQTRAFQLLELGELRRVLAEIEADS